MNQEKIGKFICKCRKEKKLTQEEFAEKIGVNSRSVSRWETGKNIPDFSLYESICKELGITINELLSGENISKDDYQKEFEKNVINLVDTVKEENKSSHWFLNIIVGILGLICLCYLGYGFYCSFEFKLSYDDMKGIEINPIDAKNIDITIRQSATMKYIITNAEDYGIIFLTYYQTLDAKNSDKENLFLDPSGNKIDTTTSGYFTERIKLEYSNIKKNYKVYYTNESFNKIIDANAKELYEIIKKSKLLYESNI